MHRPYPCALCIINDAGVGSIQRAGFIVIREKGLIDEQRLQGEHMH